VGGAAAVLHGAPIATQDLDIVHRRTEENVARLMNVLVRLDAIMRNDLANRGLRPTAAMLLGYGQMNLSTSLGPLDPLCELGKGRDTTSFFRTRKSCRTAVLRSGCSTYQLLSTSRPDGTCQRSRRAPGAHRHAGRTQASLQAMSKTLAPIQRTSEYVSGTHLAPGSRR